MPRITGFAAVAALAISSLNVCAQQSGPNGGMVAGSGSHQTELVVSSSELIVHFLVKGKTHETQGAKLRAVVQQAGKNTNVPLVDDQGKRLVGKLTAPLERALSWSSAVRTTMATT